MSRWKYISNLCMVELIDDDYKGNQKYEFLSGQICYAYDNMQIFAGLNKFLNFDVR